MRMITLPPDYTPSDEEEFMNPLQVEYFRQKLLRWRADLLKRLTAHSPASQKAGFMNLTLQTVQASKRIVLSS